MFKIADFHRIGDKIRMIIETDDASSALFVRFFSEIQKFIDIYYFQVCSASQIEVYQKTKPARMEQVYAARVKQSRNIGSYRAHVWINYVFSKGYGI